MDSGANKYTRKEFSDLFKKYWGKIFAICYKYARDYDAAKDMVQNIFITLWERDGALYDPVSIEKYLTRAAKYQFLKNAQSIHASLEDIDVIADNIIDHSHNNHQKYIIREDLSLLDKQVSLLQEPAKTIFRMSKYDHLSHKEIAARMGIAIKTVEYHLTRSIKFIRKSYR